jgi:hypothetical protein
MKLIHRIAFTSLIAAACTAPEGANPAPRCSTSADCATGSACYRGFCVIDPEVDQAMGPSETPGRGDRPDEPTDEPMSEADAGAPPDTSGRDAAPGSKDTDADDDADAGAISTTPSTDASAPVADGATPPAGACTRETLKQRADAYLAAMASGDVSSLRAHPAVRYTENGAVKQLGQGAWVGRPRTEFARHAIDETTCSSATEAVLQELLGRTVLGVRLRYVEEQLLEVEAQVVARNGQYFAPDAIVQSGEDPFIAPVPLGMRMSREALRKVAENYFASTQSAALLPAHATTCVRRQNGEPMDNRGSCSAIPGNKPFEAQRYPVIDETAGIVAAVVLYDRYVGMYLFKVQEGLVQNIEVVGGAGSRTTGW